MKELHFLIIGRNSFMKLQKVVIEDLPKLSRWIHNLSGALPNDYDNSFYTPFVKYPNELVIRSSEIVKMIMRFTFTEYYGVP